MAFPDTLSAEEARRTHAVHGNPVEGPSRSTSAVSWGAVVAGAAAAAALSLILLILGVGLGLSSVSPWAHSGVTATTLGVSTIVWLTITQLLASGMGGYLAGRLRTRWVDTQADEVYFRDTAHGFLAWAVSSLATAALLTSVIGSIVGGGVQAGASVANGAAVAATGMAQGEGDASMAYLVDTLFRRDAGVASAPDAAATTGAPSTPVDTALTNMDNDRELAEIGRILMVHNLSEPLPEDDVRHMGQLVAQRTGLSQENAQKRVTDTYARAQSQLREAETDARAAADAARKASATAALWLFVSLLVGAFCASLAATFGGRQRDA
jgi:fumarate reductase subunit D